MKQVRYGIEQSENLGRLYVDIPHPVGGKIEAGDEELSRLITKISSRKVRLIELDETAAPGAMRAYANTKRIGRYQDEGERRRAARQILQVMQGVNLWADQDERDDRLVINFGSKPMIDGTIRTEAELTLPDLRFQTVGRIATAYMRQAAYHTRLERDDVETQVFAKITRSEGINLELNEAGTLGVASVDSFLSRGQESHKLREQGIYTPTQQLVCFAGMVAAANSAQLAHNL